MQFGSKPRSLLRAWIRPGSFSCSPELSLVLNKGPIPDLGIFGGVFPAQSLDKESCKDWPCWLHSLWKEKQNSWL